LDYTKNITSKIETRMIKMSKTAIFAFQGEAVCFSHALLNVLDLNAKGEEAVLVIEGMACKLVKELANPEAPMANLYKKVKDAGLIHAVCKACSAKMGVLEEVQAQGLPLGDDLQGHPSWESYQNQGYTIITL